jgi:dimeric dUTPase (all-alpha-NTP-PPase superfamily)
MTNDRLDEIWELQAALQVSYNADPSKMNNPQLAQYIKDMTLALTDELHEALAECNWKPWAKAEPGIRNRELFIKELIDAQHFLLNLFLAARVTPDEFYEAYTGKNEVNVTRAESGYTGLEKCDNCRRALDDMLPVNLVRWHTGEQFCSVDCAQKAAINL